MNYSPDILKTQLSRIRNIYDTESEAGGRIPFIPNYAQEHVISKIYDHEGKLYPRVIILKARQEGISTLLGLLALDTILYNDHYSAALIADTEAHGKAIFKKKVKTPYEKLDVFLKQGAKRTINQALRMELENGSSMVVTTSTRSDTIQFLHVSEYGIISVKNPIHAEEIREGAFQSVSGEGVVFVESSGKGGAGIFYDMVMKALGEQRSNLPRLRDDWRLVFLPWWYMPKYAVPEEDAKKVPLLPRMKNYFAELRAKHNIKLSEGQKVWYQNKEAELKYGMFSEYPSYAEEAFKQVIEGAYFKDQIMSAYEDNRIVKNLEHRYGVPVDTWWDVGLRDYTSIILTQFIHDHIHIIDFIEGEGKEFADYLYLLEERRLKEKYIYGMYVGPHDIKATNVYDGQSYGDRAYDEFGVNFLVVPKVDKKIHSIDAARQVFRRCKFDGEKCSLLLTHLQCYSKKKEPSGVWSDRPKHDEHSHAADAFQTMAMGVVHLSNRMKKADSKPVRGKTWR